RHGATTGRARATTRRTGTASRRTPRRHGATRANSWPSPLTQRVEDVMRAVVVAEVVAGEPGSDRDRGEKDREEDLPVAEADDERDTDRTEREPSHDALASRHATHRMNGWPWRRGCAKSLPHVVHARTSGPDGRFAS